MYVCMYVFIEESSITSHPAEVLEKQVARGMSQVYWANVTSNAVMSHSKHQVLPNSMILKRCSANNSNFGSPKEHIEDLMQTIDKLYMQENKNGRVVKFKALRNLPWQNAFHAQLITRLGMTIIDNKKHEL